MELLMPRWVRIVSVVGYFVTTGFTVIATLLWVAGLIAGAIWDRQAPAWLVSYATEWGGDLIVVGLMTMWIPVLFAEIARRFAAVNAVGRAVRPSSRRTAVSVRAYR
jgi:hypothetical protein